MKYVCAALCVVGLQALAPDANACSGMLPCLTGEGFPATASVPANLPGFLVLGNAGPLALDEAHLVHVGVAETEVTTTLGVDGAILAAQPLQQGETSTLR